MYYGNLLYKLDENLFFNNMRELQEMKIPSSIDALVTMILHIIFDKKNLSPKNRIVFLKMYEDYIQCPSQNLDFKYENIFLEIAKEMYVKPIDECNANINRYKKMILSQEILNFSLYRFIYYKFCTKIKNLFKDFIRCLSNNSICILGVDDR